MASKSYGVSFVDENPRHQEILKNIESRRRVDYSRAQIIRDLCSVGLVAMEPIEDAQFRFDDRSEYEAFVEEAVKEKIERERDTSRDARAIRSD